MLENIPFIILYTGLGFYLGFLLVAQSRKAPSPKLLKMSIYFYVFVLMIDAGHHIFQAHNSLSFVDLARVSLYVKAFELAFVALSIFKLVDAFTKHREKYAKRKKSKSKSGRKAKVMESVEDEVGFLGDELGGGEIVTMAVEPQKLKEDRDFLDAMVRD